MREVLKSYFDFISDPQLEKMLSLEAIYNDWNQKINVISRKDISNFNTNHLLHSLSLAKIIRFKPGTSVLDIGTGGGFPGIPLAIMFPETKFTLVDSTRKKTIVVTEVAGQLKLDNVSVEWTRAETLVNQFDFIVSRAVTAFPVFEKWTRGKFRKQDLNELKNGILYLKGGDLKDELFTFRSRVEIYELAKYFNESFFKEKKLVYLPASK